MQLAPILAIIVSLFAFGGAVIMLFRFKDWHFGFLAAMTSFITAMILNYVLGHFIVELAGSNSTPLTTAQAVGFMVGSVLERWLCIRAINQQTHTEEIFCTGSHRDPRSRIAAE